MKRAIFKYTAPEGKMDLHITETKSEDALYKRYPGQQSPQSCYLILDPSHRKLCCDYDGEIGNAVPMDVYHGLRLRWHIPLLTGSAADRLMRDVAPLAARVCAGYTREWDGHNHVGCYTADAQEAITKIGDFSSTSDALELLEIEEV
jgi:hypothetical protein